MSCKIQSTSTSVNAFTSDTNDIRQDEIEWMIIRCLLCKSEHNMRELLFWITLYQQKIDKKDVWIFMSEMIVYSLYSYRDTRLRKYCLKLAQSDIHTDNSLVIINDTVNDNNHINTLLSLSMTMYNSHPVTYMYVAIHFWVRGTWDTVALSSIKDYENQDWVVREFETNECKNNMKPIIRLWKGMDDKCLSTCMYYSKHMDQNTWIYAIQAYIRYNQVQHPYLKKIQEALNKPNLFSDWVFAYMVMVHQCFDIPILNSNRKNLNVRCGEKQQAQALQDINSQTLKFPIYSDIWNYNIERRLELEHDNIRVELPEWIWKYDYTSQLIYNAYMVCHNEILHS